MPRAYASTGSKNGHECLYDLSCCKIAMHGFTIYGISYLCGFFVTVFEATDFGTDTYLLCGGWCLDDDLY